MHRILVVSDDPQQLAAVSAAARSEGHPLRSERTLEAGLLAVREWRPAALLLDLGLGLTPGGLAAVLRDPEVHDRTGVLLFATREQLGLAGPGVRIDDFIVPPVDPEELRVRLGRVLWLRTGADEGNVLRRGGLAIDLERYTVSVDGESVDLTYKEYELLRFLATNAGKPFTREALLNRVWGYDYYGGSRTVDVHVRRIRAKIERHEPFIETVRNVGYRFLEDTTAASRLAAMERE
jgi:DNA-binding response OmpR family regulator